MKNWMKKLAVRYEKVKKANPEQDLIILFDIDGTILDMRYMILHVLTAYDEHQGTRLFEDLSITDITVHENQVNELIARLAISDMQKQSILAWYKEHRWDAAALMESHRPFMGVMEVIRWFQMQPRTFVGLNTGRPESLRFQTLHSLNELGKEYKVTFENRLLHMNTRDWEELVPEAKADGVRHFQDVGYHVFAYVDNEPENLNAVCHIDKEKDILLLHADTLFEGKRKTLPDASISGRYYDITELIEDKNLPQHIQFVWCGINDEANLRQFLASRVQWGECDARMHPYRSEVILRPDSFDEVSLDDDEELLMLEDVLKTFQRLKKSIKLHVKENGLLLHGLVSLLKNKGIEDSSLWFNGDIETLNEEGFRRLANAFPGAIIQCPVDFLVPRLLYTPEEAKEILAMLGDWGVNRFSLDWQVPCVPTALDRMEEWGLEVNVCNVPHLEAFLKAVLLMPKSISSDFNFPKWHYYGRGSGENREHYEYSIEHAPQQALIP